MRRFRRLRSTVEGPTGTAEKGIELPVRQIAAGAKDAKYSTPHPEIFLLSTRRLDVPP